jgi:hypothetical protein
MTSASHSANYSTDTGVPATPGSLRTPGDGGDR